MRRFFLTSVLAFVACLGLQTMAEAQWGGGYNPGNGYGGYGNAGNGYGNPGYGYGRGNYFGNGGHDYQPHWHVTQTPYGPNAWYGSGPHDFVPHHHSRSPWSYQGYSNTGAGPTTSYYNPQPYYFAPW